MITVIIITHNYKKFLDKCIKSVLRNNLKIVNEIIVIDDNSIDGTFKYLKKKYKKNKFLKIHKVKFNSLTKSMNYGINLAKSEWILKIDADDYIHKKFIQTFAKYTNSYDFIYGNFVKFDKEFTKTSIKGSSNLMKFFKHPLGSGNLYKKKLWKKIGRYNEKIRFKDDVYFWVKLNIIKNVKIKYLEKFYYYYYRQHNHSMSKNLILKNFTLLKMILIYLCTKNI